MNKLKTTKIGVYALAAIFASILPCFLGAYNSHILMLALLNIILAVSLNFTLGYLGQPNFGQAALFGLGAYASAIFTVKLQAPFLISLLSGAVIGLVAGLLLGYISLQLRGAYFCMVTIAIAQTLMLVSQNLINLTGGPMGIAGVIAPDFLGRGWGNYNLWLLGILLLAIMLIANQHMAKTVVGRAWVAIRGSETLAQSVGINSFQYALLAYVVGAVFAGIGGSLYSYYVGFVDPGIFAFSWSSLAVVMVVIGGRGLVWGPVLGGLIVTLLPEYLRLAAMWRLPIFGIVVIVIVCLIPDGILSVLNFSWLKEKLFHASPADGRAVN